MRKVLFIGIIISSFLISRAVFGYDDKTTHPALTDEAVDFHNAEISGSPTSQGTRTSISHEEKEWIIQGSILEDTIPRWINHFYDPIYKVGWSGEQASQWLSKELMQKFSDVVLSPESAVSALNWVHNQELQTKYQRYLGNKTWEKALYEYVKNKNKKEAYLALGHVLHLLEDMAVPDHTRNDTHPNDSPYENYCAKFTRNTWQIVDELQKKNNKPIILNSLDEYFEYLANYSNNYFFSKDTINNGKYDKPKIIKQDGFYGYGLDKDQQQFKLVKAEVIVQDDQLKIIYSLKDVQEEEILHAYWTRLSSSAVLAGVGVIDLFFREVERAAKDESLLQPPPETQSAIVSVYGEVVRFGAAIINTSQTVISAGIKIVGGMSNILDQYVILPGQSNDPTLNVGLGSETSLTSLVPDSHDREEAAPSLESGPEAMPSTYDREQMVLPSDDVRSDVGSPTSHAAPPPPNYSTTVVEPPGQPPSTDSTTVVEPAPPAPTPSSPPKPGFAAPPPSSTFTPSLPYPGFGGGGTTKSENSQPEADQPAAENEQNEEQGEENEEPGDTTSPNPPVIVSPNDFSRTFTSANIAFSGTAEASSAISNDFNNATTTADSNANWSLSFSFNQGTTTVKFFSQDAAGNTSSSTDVLLFIDSIAPSINSFSISECQNSFASSSDGCLLAPTTLHLSWQSNADDLEYFELTISTTTPQVPSGQATTTATSTIISVLDNSTNIFSLRAKDISGNWSEPQTTTVVVCSMPVVINETAWSGTASQTSSDEWIELYNRANYDIDISGWRLYSSDSGPDIVFGEDSGSRKTVNKIIPAKGYYLIERTKDDTVNDIAADWYGSFTNGLSNSGEILILSYASTTIDQTVLCGWGPTQWCPGFDYKYRTMERIEPDIAGTEPTNWSFNNEVIKNGKTADGQNILGTPKARNSVNYLIAKGQPYISSNITLTKSNSPYVVNNTFQVFQAASILTIEPGVVIKFYNSAGFGFTDNAKIISQGTGSEPIVFTGFNDDEYGGDTNNDATSTIPVPGSWYGIGIQTANNDSIFSHTIFRYAGKYYTGMGNSMANLSVQDSSADITNSIFEYSRVYGLKLTNSNSIVTNNIFRFNNQETDPAGYNSALLATLGNPSIQANQFKENKKGLYLLNSPGTIDSNYFESNAEGAIFSLGTLPSFTNNTGSNNGLNSVNIWGNLTQANTSLSLTPNPLPYSLKGYETPTISASSTLTIEKGTIIKSIDQRINVYGNLAINGENPEDIVFTSLYDDSQGGDTTNDATSTSPAPGQFPGIFIANTGSLNAKGFTMRYGGSNGYMGNNSAGVMVDGGTADIANSLFDGNYPYGIYANNSPNIKIENARFENHNFSGSWGQKAAMAIFNSNVSLNNVSFINNALGILSDTLSTFIADSVDFIGNLAATAPEGLW